MLALGTSVAATVADETTTSATADTTSDTETPDTETEASTPGTPDDFALPPGYTMLVDNTGRLTVAVPDTWGDIDLEPDTVDGAVVPRINAATDLDVWRETFDAPGVLYAAFPYTADEEALYRDRFELRSGCAGEEVVPYDDGAFFGEWRKLTECGPSGEAELHVVVASPASEDVTVVVIVQLVGPQDQPVLDAVLQSFNFTPTATWPATSTTALGTSTSSSTTTTTAAVPASSAPAEMTYVENNSGVLSVQVPAGWDEVEATGGVNNDGSYRPAIVAAPSLVEFGGGFERPGMRVVALPPQTDPAGVLANAQQPADCESAGATPFENDQFLGLSQAWTGCAGGTLDVVLVAARPADDSFTLYAQVQEEAGGGLTPLIVESFGAPGSTAYPPPTASPSDLTISGAVPESLWQGPVQSDNYIVIDRARQLRIQVPSAWQDVRLNPSFNDDASPRPRIVASLHIETMLAQWEVPGVGFLGDSLCRRSGLPRQSDSGHARLRRRWRAVVRQRRVSRTDAHVDQLWRNGNPVRHGRREPPGQLGHAGARGAAANRGRHRPADCARLVRTALSVAVLALGTSVAATVADETTTSATADATSDTETPDTETEASTPGTPDEFALPPGHTMLVDNTGRLTVAVPDTWGDIDLEPDTVDGAVVPRINAATDLDVWRETFDAPGVLYAAFPYAADEEALYRDRFELRSGCASEEVVPYDDGAFFGEWRKLTECGPSGQAELHVVVASPTSEDVTVLVVVQLVGPQDQPVLDAVLQSFNFTPTATWPATSTTALGTSTSSSTTAAPTAPASSTPAEMTYLENNSGVISVRVPTGWDEVEATGGVNNDGSYRPAIVAAPSLVEFGGGFEHPGMRIIALPPATDPAGVLANAAQPDDCESTVRHRSTTTSSPGSAKLGPAAPAERWTSCSSPPALLTTPSRSTPRYRRRLAAG